MNDNDRSGDPVLTAEFVGELARIAGLIIPPDDLPAVAARLADLDTLAADLDDLDLDGVEPAARYDPRWPEEATA
jgi:hypothetical protein